MKSYLPGLIFCMTGIFGAVSSSQDERINTQSAGGQSHACKADEVPYFESGCEGVGTVRCWPQNIRPTPIETCLCNGRTGTAPLPGGGLRWRHSGKCAADKR